MKQSKRHYKKKVTFWLVPLLALVAVWAVPVILEPMRQNPEKHLLTVYQGEELIATYRVELAETPEARRRGLMFRKSLPKDAGMLFDFHKESEVRMWMKNTYIPLDMIFIKADKQIAGVFQNARPHSLDIIPAPEAVRYVLEINAGQVDHWGEREGLHVQLAPSP